MLNFKYVIDSVGVAKTLIKNSSKLKLHDLKKYTIVEEKHQKAKQLKVKQYVFVTGLARSGTTAVMNKIFEKDLNAS